MSNGKTLKFEDSNGTICKIHVLSHAILLEIKNKYINIDPKHIEYKKDCLTIVPMGWAHSMDINFTVQGEEKRNELSEFFANLDFYAQAMAQELSELQRASSEKPNQRFRLALRIE